MSKHISRTLLLVLFSMAVFLAGSCKKDNAIPEFEPWPDWEEDVTPIALELTEEQMSYIGSNNTFAAHILPLIQTQEDGNSFFFSPFSLAMDLTMLLNGSDGKGFGELSAILGYGEDLPLMNDYCKQMITCAPTWDSGVRFSLANAMIGNRSISFKDAFVNTLKTSFLADVSNRDFSQKDQTLDYINGWCKKRTGGLIPAILDDIEDDAALYLLNAIYFKASWSSPFEESLTEEETFVRSDGSRKRVLMMNKEGVMTSCSGNHWRALEIPYGDGIYVMQILLPDEGVKMSQLASQIQAEGWETFFVNKAPSPYHVKLPRFETNSSVNYNEIIKSLGVKEIFKGKCFSALSDDPLFVSEIIQNARIRVMEKGTESSAITSIGMTLFSAGAPLEFFCDHPFFYAIVENKTKAIFFMGEYDG